MDISRIETDIANCADLLWMHLRRMEKAENKKDFAKTVNIFASRVIGLAKEAKRVSLKYPRTT